MERIMALQKYHKFMKFLLVGGLAAGTEYMTFLSLHALGLALFWANSVSFCCGLVVSFLLNKHWVFSHRSNGGRQFAAYVALAGINLGISNLLLWALVRGIGVPALVAKVCVMLLIASWNYIVFKKVIFKGATT